LKPLRILAGQTIVYGLGTIIPRLLNYLLLTPFYTRIFITSDYGIITELYAYTAFLFVLLTYGMETTYFRFAGNSDHKSEIFSTSISLLGITSSLFIVLVLLFSGPISQFMNYPDHPEYISIMAIIIGLDSFLAIPFSKLRLDNKAFRFAYIKIINISVNILFNFFFLVICPHYYSNNSSSIIAYIYNPSFGVGYAFLSNLIATAVTLILLLPEIFRAKIAFHMVLIRKMLLYSFPLLIVGLAGMINEVSDKLLFKYLVNIPPGTVDPHSYIMAQLGIYGANFKLAVLMTIFIQMFRYAAEPFFFSHAEDKNSRYLYALTMKYFIIFCLTIFLLVTLYLDIFKLFIDKSYRSGLSIVPVVLLANLFLGILFNLSIWYKLTDKTKYGALIAISGGIITIILNFVLVPGMGYIGAAWAHFFCNLFMVVFSFLLSRKFYPIPYDYLHIALYTISAMILYFISRTIFPQPSEGQLIINTILFITFLLIIFIFERKNFTKRII